MAATIPSQRLRKTEPIVRDNGFHPVSLFQRTADFVTKIAAETFRSIEDDHAMVKSAMVIFNAANQPVPLNPAKEPCL